MMPPQESNRPSQPSIELIHKPPLQRQTTKILSTLDLNWSIGQIEVLPLLDRGGGGWVGIAEGHDPSVVVEAGSILPPALL